MLASFLPLLRECIPTAAEEIEADIQSSHTEEYVYDYYAVNEEMDISEDSSKNQFPLCVFVFVLYFFVFVSCVTPVNMVFLLFFSVIVEDEEEFCDGSDESDYDSEDSNAEDHPKTDYPEEEEEEEEEDDDDDDDESEEEKSEASDESDDEETSKRHVRSVLGDDEFDDYAEDVYGYSESDEEFES
jgi:cytoskeletal protein RodZ